MLAMENRHGEAIFNHNWGNIITWSDLQDYFKFDDNTRHFRSLPSHLDGAANFIATLLSPTNKRIVEAAGRGDFEGFFRGIHDRHPNTHQAYNLLEGSERAAVKNTYRSLVREFQDKAPVVIDATDEGQTYTKKKGGSGGGSLAILLVLSAVGGAYYASRHPKLKKYFK